VSKHIGILAFGSIFGMMANLLYALIEFIRPDELSVAGTLDILQLE
jgi:hypothetical protein